MKPQIFLISTLIGFLVISCSNEFHVKYDKDSSVDFQKYKTYAWAAPGDTTLTMKRNDKLFAGTIYLHSNEELKKKGMVRVTSKPDAVFMFDTQTEDRTKYTQAPTVSVGVGFGGPGYYVGGSVPVVGGQITATPYQDGRLIIEMFYARSHKLIWRGWGEKSIDSNADMDNAIKWVTKSILDKLPVKHKVTK